MYAISPFTIFHPTSDGSLFVKNLFTGAVVLLTDETKSALDVWLAAQDALNVPEGVADLVEQGILVNAVEDQYAVWRTAMLTARNDEAHIFTLHFEPTLQCQLACSYCLENGIERGRSMEEEILARSLAWFEEYCGMNPSVDTLRFKLFGGEPLLCKKIIARAVPAYRALCERLGIEFSLEMTTNGVLFDEDIARLLSEHIWNRVQITLDGPADIHDTRRIGKGGKPTFERILNNVRMFLAGEYLPAVDIRMTLDAGTAEHLPRLVDVLASLGDPSRVRLSLGITTPTFASPFGRMDDNELADVALATWAYAQSLGFEIPDEFVAGPVCVATAKHSAALQPDGSLQKCFCTSGRSEFDFAHVGMRPLGYTQDQRFEQWKRTDQCVSEQCPYLPVCGGGCVYEAMVEHGADQGAGRRMCRKTLLDRMNRGLLALSYE